MNSIIISPAYGRDYNTKQAIIESWISGKDFKLHFPTQETYCSIRDFPAGTFCEIRYGGMRKVTSYVIKEGEGKV